MKKRFVMLKGVFIVLVYSKIVQSSSISTCLFVNALVGNTDFPFSLTKVTDMLSISSMTFDISAPCPYAFFEFIFSVEGGEHVCHQSS